MPSEDFWALALLFLVACVVADAVARRHAGARRRGLYYWAKSDRKAITRRSAAVAVVRRVRARAAAVFRAHEHDQHRGGLGAGPHSGLAGRRPDGRWTIRSSASAPGTSRSPTASSTPPGGGTLADGALDLLPGARRVGLPGHLPAPGAHHRESARQPPAVQAAAAADPAAGACGIAGCSRRRAPAMICVRRGRRVPERRLLSAHLHGVPA